ncbi:MAG: hypothetical protein ABH837_02775, partial [bacterium]
ADNPPKLYAKEGQDRDHGLCPWGSMLADYDSGRVRVMEPKKCEKWKWFEWNNLPKNLFLPIKNLLKQKSNPFKK